MTGALNDDRNWMTDAPRPIPPPVCRCARWNRPAARSCCSPSACWRSARRSCRSAYPLEKFGNKKPDKDRFELTTALGGVQDEREEFAVAQYKKLSDSDKLSAPSFERMKSGLRFSTGDASEYRRARRVRGGLRAELRPPLARPDHLRGCLQDVRVGVLRACGRQQRREKRLLAGEEGRASSRHRSSINRGEYLVVGVPTSLHIAGLKARSTVAEAVAMHDELVASDPTLKGHVQVVAAHELAGAA